MVMYVFFGHSHIPCTYTAAKKLLSGVRVNVYIRHGVGI